MSKFKKTSIGLDIGSNYIKFAELTRSGEAITLNRFGVKEIPGDLKVDKEKTIAQLISQLLSENNVKERHVNVSVGGQSVFIRFVKLLQVKEDKLKQTMKFEAQNQIPFPLTEVAWDWSLLDKAEKGTKKAVVVAIKKNIIEDMVSRLNSIKLFTDLIDVEPISLYNCMVFNEDYTREKLGAILDIGAKTTNLVIFQKNNIWVRSFPIAGNRIIESRDQGIEEIIGEIERSIEYYFMQSGEDAQGDKKLDELLLTGGGSVIEEFEQKLTSKLNTQSKIMDPFRKIRISKEIFSDLETKKVAKNQLGVAIGLALRGMTDLKIEVNFLEEMISERYTSSQKTIYSRFSIAMAALILICFSVFMRQDYSVKRLKMNKVDEMLDIYRMYEPKIKKMQDKEDILMEKIDILYHQASSRAIWLDVFGIISGILSEEVWITDVSGIVSMEKGGLARLDLGGKALSYQAVNSFVSSLKSSPGFKDVKPISSSLEVDDKTGEETVKFNITMDVVTES